jgi:histidine triad (HIT) family protein
METFSHRPADYQCPFCSLIRDIDRHLADPQTSFFVYHDSLVSILVPTRHYANIKGNVLVVPNQHHENIFDIDCSLGTPLLEATQRVAFAMKRHFRCDGVSTRQHNEPAGYQDVWHFHIHVFPRYHNDNLYAGGIGSYTMEERLLHASALRAALGDVPPACRGESGREAR